MTLKCLLSSRLRRRAQLIANAIVDSRKGNICLHLVGVQSAAATVEISQCGDYFKEHKKKNLEIDLVHDPDIPCLGINTTVSVSLYTFLFMIIAAPFNISKEQRQLCCLSIDKCVLKLCCFYTMEHDPTVKKSEL